MGLYFFIHIVIGGVFLISGFEKLSTPYQNSLFIIQSYDVLPVDLAIFVAKGLPWVEFLVGSFLVLGLWVKESILIASLLFCLFLIVIGQALFRNLPIDECGCFGEMIVLSPRVTLILDMVLLVLSVMLWRSSEKALCLSLDSLYKK